MDIKAAWSGLWGRMEGGLAWGLAPAACSAGLLWNHVASKGMRKALLPFGLYKPLVLQKHTVRAAVHIYVYISTK